MKNMTDVQEACGRIFARLEKDINELKRAKELNNTLGKFIASARAQTEADALTRKKGAPIKRRAVFD